MARVVCFFLLGLCALGAPAQVLARPGWAGSGVRSDPWWKHAVFYRVSPELYQATGDAARGDLVGLTTRLGYIHTLGVDAIVLVPPFSADGVGDLVLAASRLHVRIVISLQAADPSRARFWLNQGVAGLLIDMPALGADPAGSLRALRRLVDSVPGDRVLLGPPVYLPANEAPQLVFTTSISGAQGASAATLRRQLAPMCDSSARRAANPLIELRGWSQPVSAPSTAAEAEVFARTLAAMAMLSRGAVIFDAGRELGSVSPDGTPLTMQWTPANVTQQPAAQPVATVAAPRRSDVYGTYTPYIPPPALKLPAPVGPRIVVEENPPAADPNTLPGFTDGTLLGPQAVNGAVANVALEDRDENSTLNFYRHLIALRNANPALRSGAETMPTSDSSQTLVWLRSAPAVARSTGAVVIAANLSAQPATIDGVSSTPLRPLLTAGAQSAGILNGDGLGPWSLVVAEVQGSGGRLRSATHARHHRH